MSENCTECPKSNGCQDAAAPDNYKLFGLIPMNWRYDLASIPALRKLFKARWFPMIPIIFNMAIFMIILAVGVVGGFSAGNYNFGIMIVWIIWWVMLMMFLVPVMSRAWCMVCPLPSIGEWLQRLSIFGVNKELNGLNMKWPKPLHNMWMMNILFLCTTFFSGFFTVRPLATFILLGGIIVLAVLTSLVFEKRTFCLYLCPVSGFQGLYSNMAMSEIRAKDRAICAKHRVKTCVTGTKKGYGCPWMLEPHSFNRNTYCGMCMECFKTCPFDNMAFNLRPPGADVLVDEKRGLDEAWKAFIMLGIACMFYVAMMGPWGFIKDWVSGATFTGWLTFAAIHSSFSLLVIPAIFFLFAWLSKVFSGEKDAPMKKVFVNMSYTLVPMGLAAWIAFSFGFLLPNGSYILHIVSDPMARGWNLFGTAGFPWTPVLTSWLAPLQFIALIGGFVFAVELGYKLAAQTFKSPAAVKRACIPMIGFLTLLMLFFGWLYGG